MDTLITVIITILAGLVVYFKKRSDNANRNAVLGTTKGQDLEIEKQQKQNEEEIRKADKEIEAHINSRNEKSGNKSVEERANKWNS